MLKLSSHVVKKNLKITLKVNNLPNAFFKISQVAFAVMFSAIGDTHSDSFSRVSAITVDCYHENYRLEGDRKRNYKNNSYTPVSPDPALFSLPEKPVGYL